MGKKTDIFVIIEGLGLDTQKVLKNLFMICTGPRKGNGQNFLLFGGRKICVLRILREGILKSL